jgi:hypothetical protein
MAAATAVLRNLEAEAEAGRVAIPGTAETAHYQEQTHLSPAKAAQVVAAAAVAAELLVTSSAAQAAGV